MLVVFVELNSIEVEAILPIIVGTFKLKTGGNPAKGTEAPVTEFIAEKLVKLISTGTPKELSTVKVNLGFRKVILPMGFSNIFTKIESVMSERTSEPKYPIIFAYFIVFRLMVRSRDSSPTIG
jgi:hypothetical protein